MAGVGVAFLAIAFGAVLGSQLAASLEGPMRHMESQKLPQFILIPALLSIGIGSTIRFRGRYQDVATSLVGSMVAFFGSRAGIAVEQIGPLAGPFLGALALGMVANAFARLFHRPPELISLPGIALLVPGSVGIKSLGALVGQDPHGGITEAFQMFMIAIALASGLMISNWVIRDRPPLQSDSLPA